MVDQFLDIADPLPGKKPPLQVAEDFAFGKIPLPNFSETQRKIYVFSRIKRDLANFYEQSQG